MRRQNREATAAGIGLGTTAKYMQQATVFLALVFGLAFCFGDSIYFT
jgi:hypothetical protein